MIPFEEIRWKVGDEVWHGKYGYGVVTEIDEEKYEIEETIEVQFEKKEGAWFLPQDEGIRSVFLSQLRAKGNLPPNPGCCKEMLKQPCVYLQVSLAFAIKADEAEFWQRAASAEATFGRVPCPTCEGEGGCTVPTKDPTHEDYIRTECQDCYGYGTLRAPELVTMVLELRAANGELHDAMAAQQASHEAEMLDAARSSLVRLCRELDLPIHEDPRTGIRDAMAVFRVASNTKEAT